MRRIAPDRRNHPIADNQESVFGTRRVPLDNDVVAAVASGRVSDEDLFAGRQVQAYPMAIVGIPGFDDDRSSQLAGSGPGIVGVIDRPSGWNGHADGAEQALGQFFVL